MQKNYAEHHASVTVHAPVHQVYSLFTHFNDFPKFMSFVKEVTYRDNQTSHWVAEVAGQHEWDAVNDNWQTDHQVGWHSTSGLENFGKVVFEPIGTDETKVDAFVNYVPPAGVLGTIGEKLGAGSRFEHVLQHDLEHFAQMVNQAPPEALDPTSSSYLFHKGSAAAQDKTTERQNQTMYEKPNAVKETTTPVTDRDITGTTNKGLAQDVDTGAMPFEPTQTTTPEEDIGGNR